MKLPAKLKLKDGIKWTGHMTVSPPDGLGKYQVKFDARDRDGGMVYDVYMFTRDLVIDWTGVDPLDKRPAQGV